MGGRRRAGADFGLAMVVRGSADAIAVSRARSSTDGRRVAGADRGRARRRARACPPLNSACFSPGAARRRSRPYPRLFPQPRVPSLLPQVVVRDARRPRDGVVGEQRRRARRVVDGDDCRGGFLRRMPGRDTLHGCFCVLRRLSMCFAPRWASSRRPPRESGRSLAASLVSASCSALALDRRAVGRRKPGTVPVLNRRYAKNR